MSVARVAFLGLGVMGGPMAGHLAKAGHHVTVYNRTRSKAEQWCKEHATGQVTVADTPKQAAQNAELVVDPLRHDLKQIFPRAGPLHGQQQAQLFGRIGHDRGIQLRRAGLLNRGEVFHRSRGALGRLGQTGVDIAWIGGVSHHGGDSGAINWRALDSAAARQNEQDEREYKSGVLERHGGHYRPS